MLTVGFSCVLLSGGAECRHLSWLLFIALVGGAGGDDDPYTTSFRGIDSPTYYMTDTSQYVQLLNFSGCGNTTNANSPAMKKLIIDSLRM